MLVSPSTNDYGMSTTPAPSVSRSYRVRTRTLDICEPAFPTRDDARQENYARRKVQEFQGWACPRTIPYQGIEPVHLPPKPIRPIVPDRSTVTASTKPTSGSESVTNRAKSSSVVQDDNLIITQFETNIRRLQTAQQKHMKKASDILRRVQHGHSVKDVVEKYSQVDENRIESANRNQSISLTGDEQEQDALYDRLLDDFDEEDDVDESSVSGIRDDIMSPRTIINRNVNTTDMIETLETQRYRPAELPSYPVKLCHSAPPLNRKNVRQAIIRPFTPRYNSLSARLRIQNKMPFRDALYRQLCGILWLLRSMRDYVFYIKKEDSKSAELISGCWNIEQWLKHDPNSKTDQGNQPDKKPNAPTTKRHPKALRSGTALMNTPYERFITYFSTLCQPNDSLEKKHAVVGSSISRLSETHSSSQTGSHALNDSADRLDVLITSVNTERDLNESISSKSIQEDTTDNTNLDSSQRTTNVSLTGPTSVIPTSNTSRTSLSSDVTQVLGHSISGRLSSILEQRRRPDMLLKRWNKRQTITAKNPKEPLPLPEKELRLLHAGDKGDLDRIFGLENATSTNKEEVRMRQTREIKRKLVANVKRRPATSDGSAQSKLNAQSLYRIKREWNEFVEEQTTLLNNKLERIDDSRLLYYQSKLSAAQQIMAKPTRKEVEERKVAKKKSPIDGQRKDREPKYIIINRVLPQLRYDKDKKKMSAVHLKYQPWYIDLLEMVQPDYHDDYMIKLLLDEMGHLADPADIPTVSRFRGVLRALEAHEICHPDIMAAIEFTRVHIVKMAAEDFDIFFCKQFPTVTSCIASGEENEDDNGNEDTISDIQ